MKKSKLWTFIFGLFLVVLIIYFTYSIANWKYYSKKTKPTPTVIIPTEVSPLIDSYTVKDYVCERLIDKRTAEFKEKYLEYEFYFCSKECRDKFVKDPLKYLPLRIKIKIKSATPTESPGVTTPLPEITMEDLNQAPTVPATTPTVEQNYPEDTIEVIPEGGEEPVPTKTIEIQEDL